MSRSFKKVPIFGNTGTSDKQDKQIANRRLRSNVKQKLNTMIRKGAYNMLLPTLRDVSNVWDFNKDGKHYWGDATKKDLRK